MSRINSRNKGASGEREFADWLQLNFNLEHKPERNLEQVRKGGHDILGFPPFAFEVKRCEVLEKRKWWVQAKNSATSEYHEPVVAYRQNRRKWKFLIGANHIGLQHGFIELEHQEFLQWVNRKFFGGQA